MTISSPIRQEARNPRIRLGLAWLLSSVSRVRATWGRIYQRGQMGAVPGGFHVDERHRHCDRIFPRAY